MAPFALTDACLKRSIIAGSRLDAARLRINDLLHPSHWLGCRLILARYRTLQVDITRDLSQARLRTNLQKHDHSMSSCSLIGDGPLGLQTYIPGKLL